MAINSTRTIALAQRLINVNGRPITLIKFDTTLAVPGQPWKGPTDPRATPDATLSLSGVFVPIDESRELGFSFGVEDLTKDLSQVCLVSPGAAVDLKIYNEVIDEDTTRWKIGPSKILKPGSEVLLGFLGLSQ